MTDPLKSIFLKMKMKSVLSSSNKSSQRNVIKSQEVCKFLLTCILLNLTVHANFLQQCPYWIKDLSLSYKHKTIIETNEMLTDEHIQAAQNLRKSNFNI